MSQEIEPEPLTEDDFFCLQCIEFGDEDRERSHDCPEHLRRNDVEAAVKEAAERIDAKIQQRRGASELEVPYFVKEAVEEGLEEAFAGLNGSDGDE